MQMIVHIMGFHIQTFINFPLEIIYFKGNRKYKTMEPIRGKLWLTSFNVPNIKRFSDERRRPSLDPI